MKSGNIILCVFVFCFYQNVKALQLWSSASGDAGFYKAAVYEHPLILPAKLAKSYEEAVQQMMLNLNVYKKQADIAGSQTLRLHLYAKKRLPPQCLFETKRHGTKTGRHKDLVNIIECFQRFTMERQSCLIWDVDIIVFPEYGIYGYKFAEPTEIEPYLEYIPDPNKIIWTPCVDPDRFDKTKVLTFLSCLAMNNSFYLVANYGDSQPCTSQDPNCPANGQYQYNTNIVFNRKGMLIARYHKIHLFFEKQYQEPIHPERIFFDTEFGRFGTFTCFDIVFYDPAITLVEQLNITNVVFPTAWTDGLPYFSAIGYHSSFAVAYSVNFLASNLHLPSNRIQGSGIYTPNGAYAYYYDNVSPYGRLLVHEIPILNRKRRVSFTFGSSELEYLKIHDFKAKVFHDWYNFVTLGSRTDNFTVCMEELCCFLSYDRDEIIGNYAFGVFSGMHEFDGQYYFQVCILLKCASDHHEDCGKVTYTADGYFNSFNIRGNFSTPYVTPQIITSNNGSLELPPLHSMTYDTNGLTGNARATPLLEACLIGRIYHVVPSETDASVTHLISSKINILMQLISILYVRVFIL